MEARTGDRAGSLFRDDTFRLASFDFYFGLLLVVYQVGGARKNKTDEARIIEVEKRERPKNKSKQEVSRVLPSYQGAYKGDLLLCFKKCYDRSATR